MENSDAMKCFHRTLVFDFGSSNTVVCDETGQIVRFPGKQEVAAEWKDRLLYRALFANPMLPLMRFKPVSLGSSQK